MSDEPGPPYDGDQDIDTSAGPDRHRTALQRASTVLVLLAVVASAVVGTTVVLRNVEAGRAAAAGECAPDRTGPCLERRTATLDLLRSRRGRTTWDAEGLASSFSLGRTTTRDYGLADGARVDLLTHDDRVVVIETDTGRFDLPTSGYSGAVTAGMAMAGLVLALGSSVVPTGARWSRRRIVQTAAATLPGPAVGALLAQVGAPVAGSLAAAVGVAAFGAVVGSLLHVPGHD